MRGPDGAVTTLVVPPECLAGETVEIDGAAYHHLFRVRRLARDERLRLVDGLGTARWARVERVGRRSAVARPEEPAPANEPPWEVELFVAPPRPRRLAWLVEKATEVGVSAVRLAEWRRSGRRPGEGSLERLRRIAREAVEQSHRARVPEVTGPHAADEVAQRLASLPERWLLTSGAGPGPAVAPGRATAVLVGPEGGWEEEELARWRAAGCRTVSLGAATLRVETAAVVGVALAAGVGRAGVR